MIYCVSHLDQAMLPACSRQRMPSHSRRHQLPIRSRGADEKSAKEPAVTRAVAASARYAGSSGYRILGTPRAADWALVGEVTN